MRVLFRAGSGLVAIVWLFSTALVAQAAFTHRLVEVRYDYDNNGLTDATTIIGYESDGRATSEVYTYTGDGTADLFITEDDDAASETSTLDGTSRTCGTWSDAVLAHVPDAEGPAAAISHLVAVHYTPALALAAAIGLAVIIAARRLRQSTPTR